MLDMALLFLNVLSNAQGQGSWVYIEPLATYAEEFDRHYSNGRNPNDNDDSIKEAYDSTIDINSKLRISQYLSMGREDIGIFATHAKDKYYSYFDFNEEYYKNIGVYYFLNDRAYVISLPWIPSTEHIEYEIPTDPKELKMFNMCFSDREFAGERKGIRLYILDVACAHINAGTTAVRLRNVETARKHCESAALAIKMFGYVTSKLSDTNRELCSPIIQVFSSKITTLQDNIKWLETHSLTLSDNSGSPQAK